MRSRAERLARALRAPSALLILERALVVVGVLLLGYYGYVSVEARLYQAYENRELDAILQSGPSANSHGAAATRATRAAPAPGTVIGRIEIPRLRVSTIVRAGSDARTLRLAVGHIDQDSTLGTGLPDGPALQVAGKDDVGLIADDLELVNVTKRPVVVTARP